MQDEIKIDDMSASSAADDVKLPDEPTPQPVNVEGDPIPTPEPPVDNGGAEQPESTTAPAEKSYMGKLIISEKMETINEKEYHSLTLGDGSTHLLTQDEYKELTK